MLDSALRRTDNSGADFETTDLLRPLETGGPSLSIRPFSSAAHWLRRRRSEWLLFFAAAAIYLPGLDWGLPQAWSANRVYVWAFDDISPLPALTEVYHTFVRSAPDRWLAYPLAHHFLLGAAYAPYLGWLALTGRFAELSPRFPFGLADPVTAFQTLTLIARLVSILMAAGIVVTVYRIGAAVWDRRTGLGASLAVAAAYPMFYYTKTACLEIPYLFWASLAALAYVRILQQGPDTKRMAALGALAALAAATKDQAAGLFLLLPLPLAWSYWRGRARAVSPYEPAALFGAGSIAYALASGLAFDPERYLAHLRWILRPEGLLSQEFVAWYPESIWFPDGLTGTLRHTGAILEALVGFLGPVLTAVAAVGLAETAVRNRSKLWVAFPAVSYFFTFLIAIGHFQRRYVLPLMLFTALFAGRGLTWVRGRLSSLAVFALFVAVAFAGPVSLSVGLVRHMIHDTRRDAERWLASEMKPGDRIAAAHEINALPRAPQHAVVMKLPPGHAALSVLEGQQPEFVSVIPDWSSVPGTPYSRAYPPELFNRLDADSLGYVLAAKFDSGFWREKPLLDYPAVSPPVRIYRKVKAGSP